jgi:hypothetical protein
MRSEDPRATESTHTLLQPRHYSARQFDDTVIDTDYLLFFLKGIIFQTPLPVLAREFFQKWGLMIPGCESVRLIRRKTVLPR